MIIDMSDKFHTEKERLSMKVKLLVTYILKACIVLGYVKNNNNLSLSSRIVK